MKIIKIIAVSLLVSVFCQPVFAGDAVTKLQDKFKGYVNDVITDVKETSSPVEKRHILNQSFNKMLNALDKVENSFDLNEEETAYINATRDRFLGYQNELNGENGVAAVADAELNDFANYVQQDIEQADKVITISLTSLLLIIIIVILLA